MSKQNCTLTREFVSEILEYDPETGHFWWKDRSGKRSGLADSMCQHGYMRVKINGKTYKQHRLAWFLIHNEWPEMIDHINRIKTDNRMENLRAANNHENQMNRDVPCAHNQSGFLGVNFNGQAGRYAARIQVGGKRIHIGYFDSPEMASAAYNAKKAELSQFSPSGCFSK